MTQIRCTHEITNQSPTIEKSNARKVNDTNNMYTSDYESITDRRKNQRAQSNFHEQHALDRLQVNRRP